MVDGVEVIQEVETSPAPTTPSAGTAALPSTPAGVFNVAPLHNMSSLKTSPPLGITMTDYSPPLGHADVLSDITMVQGSQGYIVSASKDGVVKVWK